MSVAVPAATPPADRPDKRRPFMDLSPSRDVEHLTVETEGEDRFTIRVAKAVEYLRVASRQGQFEQQGNLLLDQLDRWVSAEARVERAYITLRDEALLFPAVMDRMERDPKVEDRLSDLDLRLHHDQDLDLVQLNAMAVPAVSPAVLSDFLDPNFSLTYVGQNAATGETVPS